MKPVGNASVMTKSKKMHKTSWMNPTLIVHGKISLFLVGPNGVIFSKKIVKNQMAPYQRDTAASRFVDHDSMSVLWQLSFFPCRVTSWNLSSWLIMPSLVMHAFFGEHVIFAETHAARSHSHLQWHPGILLFENQNKTSTWTRHTTTNLESCTKCHVVHHQTILEIKLAVKKSLRGHTEHSAMLEKKSNKYKVHSTLNAIERTFAQLATWTTTKFDNLFHPPHFHFSESWSGTWK